LAHELLETLLVDRVRDDVRPSTGLRDRIVRVGRAAHVLERGGVVGTLAVELGIVAEHAGGDELVRGYERRGADSPKRLAVDRGGTCTSDLDVVERRHLDVHGLAEDLRAAAVVAERLPPRIALEAQQIGADEIADDVEIAAQELERLAGRVLVQRPANAVE